MEQIISHNFPPNFSVHLRCPRKRYRYNERKMTCLPVVFPGDPGGGPSYRVPGPGAVVDTVNCQLDRPSDDPYMGIGATFPFFAGQGVGCVKNSVRQYSRNNVLLRWASCSRLPWPLWSRLPLTCVKSGLAVPCQPPPFFSDTWTRPPCHDLNVVKCIVDHG